MNLGLNSLRQMEWFHFGAMFSESIMIIEECFLLSNQILVNGVTVRKFN